MGYYTETEPNAEHSFLERIAHALDLDPYALAQVIGVDYEEDLLPLWLAQRSKLTPLMDDPVWGKLAAYTDKRLGQLLAVRAELRNKLHDDVKRKIRERSRMQRG